MNPRGHAARNQFLLQSLLQKHWKRLMKEREGWYEDYSERTYSCYKPPSRIKPVFTSCSIFCLVLVSVVHHPRSTITLSWSWIVIGISQRVNHSRFQTHFPTEYTWRKITPHVLCVEFWVYRNQNFVEETFASFLSNSAGVWPFILKVLSTWVWATKIHMHDVSRWLFHVSSGTWPQAS